MQRAHRPLAVVLVVSFTFAFLTIMVAIGFGGAGHGWATPTMMSFPAVITNPLAGIAFVWRDRRWAKMLAVLVLTLSLAGDVALPIFTFWEGTSYFHRSWNKAASLIVCWAVAWSYVQVLAGVTLLAKPPWPR